MISHQGPVDDVEKQVGHREDDSRVRVDHVALEDLLLSVLLSEI